MTPSTSIYKPIIEMSSMTKHENHKVVSNFHKMNFSMSRIGLYLIIILFCVQPLFGQTVSETDTTSESTQDRKIEENNISNSERITSQTPIVPTDTDETEPGENNKPESENISPFIPENLVDSEIQQNTSSIMELDTDDSPNISKTSEKVWTGKLRLLKIVNDYQVKPDETLTTLVMIAGDATIHGTITGNVLLIGGDVKLSSSAQVNGVLQVIGGQIIGTQESVENISVNNGWRILPAVAQILMHPHTVWDINKHRNIRITLAKFLLFLFIYLVVVLIFPRPINTLSKQLARKPLVSILFSLLMFVVLPVLAAILILSIVGVPCLLLGICLIVPVAICGKVGIFYTLGSTLLSGRLKPLSVIFGYIPYFMATEIPHVDWVTFLVFNTVGIGLCILSILSGMSTLNRSRNNYWTERIHQ